MQEWVQQFQHEMESSYEEIDNADWLYIISTGGTWCTTFRCNPTKIRTQKKKNSTTTVIWWSLQWPHAFQSRSPIISTWNGIQWRGDWYYWLNTIISTCTFRCNPTKIRKQEKKNSSNTEIIWWSLQWPHGFQSNVRSLSCFSTWSEYFSWELV